MVHLSYTVINSCGTGCEQLMIISQCISQCIPARVSVHKSGQSGRVSAWVWNENKVAGYTYIVDRYRLLCMLCTIGICKVDGVDYRNTKCISLWIAVNLHNLHKAIVDGNILAGVLTSSLGVVPETSHSFNVDSSSQWIA